MQAVLEQLQNWWNTIYEEVGYDHLVLAYAEYQWSWVQYYTVDVWSVLVVTTAGIVLTSYALIRSISRSCRSRKTKIE